MAAHVCPWWGGYFIDNRFRRLLHKPEQILDGYLRPGMTVLDFGCGMGFFAIPIASMLAGQGMVVAVDLQQQMLDVLHKRAARAGVADRIRPHRCESNHIGVDEATDFVLAFWSAHEAPSFRGLVSELHHRLVSGGRLLLVEPRGHVSAQAFQAMIEVSEQVGLSLENRPSIRLSRAAVFAKQ
jgi:ubiquinone/menaquinone biosynthesis C-methylase UbiE